MDLNNMIEQSLVTNILTLLNCKKCISNRPQFKDKYLNTHETLE